MARGSDVDAAPGADGDFVLSAFPDYPRIAETMRRLLPRVLGIAERVPYEEQGILYSEVLFLLACIEGTGTKRIVESGRARAQSTLLLSLALPDVEIVSVELDDRSLDVPVAAERLKTQTNVRLLFGDSRTLIPKLLQAGDIVLIDGPKGFRSVRMAASLLEQGLAAQIFVHDLTYGTAKRSFVAANFPEALFSDRRELVAVGSQADARIGDRLPPQRRLETQPAGYGYGFGLGVIPHTKGRPYRWLRAKAGMAGQVERIASKLRRRG